MSLELGNADRSPVLSGADHGTKHQLQHWLFAEGVGNDLELPSLLDKQALEKIGRPNRAAMGDRHPQMRDTAFEVVLEAGDGAWQCGLVVLDQTRGQITGDGA